MKLLIDIESDNEAANNVFMLRRWLYRVIDELTNWPKSSGMIRDGNGNTIGRWEYDPSS